LVVDQIKPGVLPGLGQDWFDVLKAVSLRPSGPGQLMIALGTTPGLGRDPEDVLAYHRLAELQAMGVALRQVVGLAPESATLVLDSFGPHSARAYRWSWAYPLSPSLVEVQRNRLGREEEVLTELGGPPRTVPVSLPKLRNFHRFTIQAGRGADPAHDDYLGKLLVEPIDRLLMIDPFTTHNDPHVHALDRFLKLLKPSAGAMVRVKTRKIRDDIKGRDRGTDFTTVQQARECRRLVQAHPRLSLEVRPTWIDDHDRTILLRNGAGLCYKVILGQGVYGFEAECRSRTEGVWFEVDDAEFQKAWNEF
jgi:hypothetical protein